MARHEGTRIVLLLSLCMTPLLAGCMTATVQLDRNRTVSTPLRTVVTGYTEEFKRLDSFYAPYYNVEEDLGKFGDYPSDAYFLRAKALYQDTLKKLNDLPVATRTAFSNEDRILFALIQEDIETRLEGLKYPDELLAFNQMENRLLSFMEDSDQALTSFPFDSVKHYDSFLSRIEGLPRYVFEQIKVLNRGIANQVTLSCQVASRVPITYAEALEPEVEKNPFWRPITFMPTSFSDSDRKRLEEGFRRAITEVVVPSYRKFDAYFNKEYRSHCRETYGIGKLARGGAWYAQEIRAKTGLSLAPSEIHQLGLKEVRRIETEIREIARKLGHRGSLRSFLVKMTSDPKYFFKSGPEMLAAFDQVRSAVASKVKSYFSLVPQSEYKIVEASNPEDAAGAYRQPTELLPFGRFVVNTKNVRSVPMYGVTTLSLHEAVPGHHFQLALQFERQAQLSEYQRKIFDSVAYVEGWALYAEHLGREMGMFQDPLQRLGNLNDEMLRAVRLVVDTGIHSMGWNREKTIQYMTDHLATDAKDISNEANRYSVWPGQALGYKLGQLKILELRTRAEKRLGAKFDIREFHRVVLENGAVSLSVLETQVENWIIDISGRAVAHLGKKQETLR